MKTLQGAEDRLAKSLEQIHAMREAHLDQANELRSLRETAAGFDRLNADHLALRATYGETQEALIATRKQLHLMREEREVVFAELRKIGVTCDELTNLVESE